MLNSNEYSVNNYFNNQISYINIYTPITFYLAKNDLFKMLYVINNLNKIDLLKNFPHLYPYIPHGINILKSNNSFISNHINNFVYSIENKKKKIYCSRK